MLKFKDHSGRYNIKCKLYDIRKTFTFDITDFCSFYHVPQLETLQNAYFNKKRQQELVFNYSLDDLKSLHIFRIDFLELVPLQLKLQFAIFT